MMEEAVRTSETLVNFNVTTQHYIPEDSKLQIYIYIIGKCCLVGDHLLMRDFGLYGIVILNVHIVTVMQLRDFGPY
jgi:hypothetical protein